MKNHYLKKASIGTVILILVMITLLFPSAGFAQQMAITHIQITNVDEREFPDVTVRALIRDGNNSPVPDSDISNLELTENGLAVNFQHQRVTSGIEIIYVMDAGLGINSKSITGRTRMEQMKDAVRSFLLSMADGDTAALAIVNPGEVGFPQPLTADQGALLKGLDNMDASPEVMTRGLDGVLEAISELSKSSKQGKVVQAVVLLTSGIQTNTTGAQKVIDTALKEDIFIHTVLVRDDVGDQDMLLERIASDTNGIYAHYSGPNALSTVQEWINTQRDQYEFRFRSSSAASSDRTLQLHTKGTSSGLVADTDTYQVQVQPPRVVLDQPASNNEIVRSASSYDVDLDQVQPTTLNVVAHVEWPDGYERPVKEAIFLLDNVVTGVPINYPSSDNITFKWDLRTYRSAGSNPAQIQIRVLDEFDQQGLSEPTPINITVIIPPVPASGNQVLIDQECEGLSGLGKFGCQSKIQARLMFTTPTGWISLISLVVAIAAVVFAFRFKGRIVEAGGAAFDIVRETITRLTRPGSSEVGAFLEVVRGDEALIGKQIPLYTRTVTPAGRSPQEAELVFDLANDQSVVSRRHCEFRDDDGIYKLRDLGSSHGTFVNGIRLPEGGEGQILSEGDRIELGPVDAGVS